MTIAERNRLRLGSIIIMFLIFSFAFVASLAVFLMGNFETRTSETANVLLKFAITAYSQRAVCLSILIFPFFSLVILSYIYFSFKKTHAIEISFFVVYLFSLGFETLRLVFPIYPSVIVDSESIAYISRLVYVARLSGIISLFMSSIFAIKIITRQISYLIFFSCFIAFSLVFSMPVSNFYSDRFFFAGKAYYYPYALISMAIGFLTCLTYYFAYISKNAKEYLSASISLIFVIIGYWVLIYSESYLSLIIGTFLFAIPVMVFLKSIHSYHIWQ